MVQHPHAWNNLFCVKYHLLYLHIQVLISLGVLVTSVKCCELFKKVVKRTDAISLDLLPRPYRAPSAGRAQNGGWKGRQKLSVWLCADLPTTSRRPWSAVRTPGACARWAPDAWPSVLAAAGGTLLTLHNEAKQQRHVCPRSVRTSRQMPWEEEPCLEDFELKLPVFKRINK